MAIVRTPFVSFGASGKLAKTLVAFNWKGLDVMREYVVPTNPRTADQVTQRTLFTTMVFSWRNYFTNAAMRSAWNVLATILPDPMSGFNAQMRNMLLNALVDPDASYAFDAVAASGTVATFGMLNIDDGSTGDETGDFEVWAGIRAASLLKVEDVAIVTGNVVTTSLGSSGDIIYVKLRKAGWDRSGIVKLTLIT